MNFAEQIKSLRVARGQSLQQVADAVGISKPHLWQLERGESKNPTLEVVLNLSKHFGVTIPLLLGENVNQQNLVFGREVRGRLNETDMEQLFQLAQRLAHVD